MGMWLIAFVMLGQLVLPMALTLLGLDQDAMSVRGAALLHLCLDLAQLAATLGILWGSLRKFKPRSLGLFPVRLWPPSYLGVVAACTALFPLIDYIAQHALTWFDNDAEVWTSQVEQSLTAGDWVTNIAYFAVFSLCAPVWEELMFRGFLLPSFARYMPRAAAVAASSLVFALCHFKLQTMLPLLLLGAVFSSVYLYCRNLVPCILLHSLWNVYVLVVALFRPF